jgi:hypothetical protein
MDGFGQGFADALKWIFYLAILGIVLGGINVGYIGYKYLVGFDEEIVSPHRITPKLKLNVKDNKVDTLYIYKLKK